MPAPVLLRMAFRSMTFSRALPTSPSVIPPPVFPVIAQRFRKFPSAPSKMIPGPVFGVRTVPKRHFETTLPSPSRVSPDSVFEIPRHFDTMEPSAPQRNPAALDPDATHFEMRFPVPSMSNPSSPALV